MPDFHVVALLYRLELSDHISYADPSLLVFENEIARFRLEQDQLRCELKVHLGTSEEARGLLDPILRDWETEVELRRGGENCGSSTRTRKSLIERLRRPVRFAVM